MVWGVTCNRCRTVLQDVVYLWNSENRNKCGYVIERGNLKGKGRSTRGFRGQEDGIMNMIESTKNNDGQVMEK